jgi:hypothetical protein
MNYELSEREWTITKQLHDILKVSDVSNPWITDSSYLYTGLEGYDIVLLLFNT